MREKKQILDKKRLMKTSTFAATILIAAALILSSVPANMITSESKNIIEEKEISEPKNIREESEAKDITPMIKETIIEDPDENIIEDEKKETMDNSQLQRIDRPANLKQVKNDDARGLYTIFYDRPYGSTESWGFSTSVEYAGYICVDDFYGLVTPFNDLHWWGLTLFWTGSGWLDSTPAGMGFNITIYEDDMGAPGAVHHVYENVTPAYEVYDAFGGFTGYKFTVDPLVPECTLSAGWISIEAVYSPAGDYFLWSWSPEGNLNGMQNTVPYNYSTMEVIENSGFEPQSLAFELTYVPLCAIDVEKTIWIPPADAPSYPCDYQICLYDSFSGGDGWNGGSLNVSVNEEPLYTGLTLITGQGPECYDITVNNTDIIGMDYTYGSWPTENEWYLLDCFGVEVYRQVGGPDDDLYDDNYTVISDPGIWVDADDPDSAVDWAICTNVTFYIDVTNRGTCEITDINVTDFMEDSMEFVSTNTTPYEIMNVSGGTYLYWEIASLPPFATVTIIVTAHVIGPHCSIDENYVNATAYCPCEPMYVFDEDSAFIHCRDPFHIDVEKYVWEEGRPCNYQICLYDSYSGGDGWNGGLLDVSVNGVPLYTGLTLITGQGPECHDITVKNGDVIGLDYTYGSYPGENEWYLLDCSGVEVYRQVGGYSHDAYDDNVTAQVGAWRDADNASTAVDVEILQPVNYLIAIHNDGMNDLVNITLDDIMDDSVEFVEAYPEPDYEFYNATEGVTYLSWYNLGNLSFCEWFYITINGTAVGENCSFDENNATVIGEVPDEQTSVIDQDSAFIHCVDCIPFIDIEKYVWDEETEEWANADDEGHAVDVHQYENATFLISIHNIGRCCGLTNILVTDFMEDSMVFVNASHTPDSEGPVYGGTLLTWTFPDPLPPCNYINITINATVIEPYCSIDENYVNVTAYCNLSDSDVYDEDSAFVHADYPYYIDVGTESIDYPTGTQTTGTYTVSATIGNYGNMDVDNIPVNCSIYNETYALVYGHDKMISSISAGGFASVEFNTSWTVTEEGEYVINVTTQHGEDTIPGNDSKEINVTIDDRHDVGTVSINYPTGNQSQGEHTVNATVKNYGDVNETSFDVNCSIYKRTYGTPIYSEDFDADDGGYSHGGPTDIWEWGTPTSGPGSAHSGANCWGTNLTANYPVNANATLDSSPINLPSGSVELSFWHWYDTENYYDGGNVKISNDSGSNWYLLGSYPDQYNEDAAFTGNAGIPGEPCFSGHGQGFWEEVTFDLSAYAGETVIIRWHFGSDSSVIYPGWFIDDVEIVPVTYSLVYYDYETVGSLLVDESTFVEFDPAWTVLVIGDYLINVATQLDGDEGPDNDEEEIIVHIEDKHDAGTESINYPTGIQPTGTHTVNATVKNHGTGTDTIPVNCSIYKINYGTAEFSEDFEASEGIPLTWIMLTNDTYVNGQWVDSSSYAHSGSYCVKGDPGTGVNDAWLITEQVSLSSSPGDLTFWYRSEGSSYDCSFEVLVSTNSNASNLSEYTQIGDFTTTSTTYTEGTLNIDSYANQDVYIAFRLYYGESAFWYMFLDDVKIAPPTTYSFVYGHDETVIDLASGASTFVEFNASWEVYEEADYLINVTTQLGTELPGTSGNDAKEITMTIRDDHDVRTLSINYPTGIQPLGTHPVNATVDNYGNKEETFDVNCTIHKINYAANLLDEDFEGTFPPAGWSVINNGGDCVWERNDLVGTSPRPNYAGTGYCADADADKCGSGTTMDTELWSPTFNLASPVDLTFNSYYDYLSAEYATVDISTDNGSNWIELANYSSDHDLEITIDLSPYVGNATCKIRWHYYSPGYNWYWEIDDVRISTPPSYTLDYTEEETVTGLAPGASTSVVFNSPWTVLVEGDYIINVTTKLGSDEDTSNDYKEITVTMQNLLDVGTQSINYPVDGNAYDAGNHTVNATIENNYYNRGLTVPVNCSIYESLSGWFEDFEGSFPPAGWSVINNGGDCVWDRNDLVGTSPRTNYAGGNGYCADADVDRCGSGTTMDTELWSPTFSLAKSAVLTYITSFNAQYDGSDSAIVDISTNGGGSWIELLNWSDDHDDYGPGELVTIDLSNYTGNDSCIIRWHYVAPGWHYWWEIDDVELTYDLGDPIYTNEQNPSVPALSTAYVEFNAPWNATPGDYIIKVTTMLPGDVIPDNNATEIFVHINETDSEPPEITGITVLHSVPKDTVPAYGWENFTCNVTDDSEVDTVQLNITYPDSSSHTFTMTKNGDTYYYNTSLTAPGGENTPGYNYHIYATDTSGKENTSTSALFKLPMNEDVDQSGVVGFVDIMMVAGMWNAGGPNGWIRADVDNSGVVGFVDIMMVAGMWNAQW